MASFSFVLRGSYLENYGARPLTRKGSTIVFHPPQESHAVEYQSEPVGMTYDLFKGRTIKVTCARNPLVVHTKDGDFTARKL